jgi:hypothetical protein
MMITLKNTSYWLTALFLIVLCNGSCDRSNQLILKNDFIELRFSGSSGQLQYFCGYRGADSVPVTDMTASIWEIKYSDSAGVQTLNTGDASRFRHWMPDDTTLILEWDHFTNLINNNMAVTAMVRIESRRSMSHWRISLDGISGIQVDNLIFPSISKTQASAIEYLAVPEWMGQLMKNPGEYLAKTRSRRFEWSYPGPLSMQFAALYSSQKGGLYIACDDTLAYRKTFTFALDSTDNFIFQAGNLPPVDTSQNKYEPQYGYIIGTFHGDWITAAEIYREWGTRQKWSRDSRFINGRTPEWLEKNSLWIWNRGRSSNVLIPAEDLQQRLKLPLSVYWHWWHGCSYDDGFPEYIPPREGAGSFISAMDNAHKKGINAIVYMNQALWGTTTDSWKNEEAEKYAAKDINGNIQSHVFNIFSGKPTAYMCMGTQFWKDKYSSLCDSAVNRYTANGVYMDMACLNTICYDRSHGHPVGGGNYHLQNFGKMTDLIRSKIRDKQNVVLAGEGAGEVWLPYLDLFLTLAVSKERYAGPGAWETIPLFQAVYHQYSITYGNYSSLLVPPYDELWPKKYAPAEPLKMLDKKFSQQFLMEQARSFVWGLQPTLSNYQPFLASERKEEIDFIIRLAKVRNENLKYLLKGKFMRSPVFSTQDTGIDISRLSIYAGKMGESVVAFHGTYPLLYSCSWLSGKNTLGIAIASISNSNYPLNIDFKANEYGLSDKGSVFLSDHEGKTRLGSYSGGAISVKHTLKPRDICLIEIIPD